MVWLLSAFFCCVPDCLLKMGSGALESPQKPDETGGWESASPIIQQPTQVPGAASDPVIQGQGLVDSPAVTRWKELTRQRRLLQREVGTRLSGMTMVVQEDQLRQLAEIQQIRVQMNGLKLEMLSAAAEGFAELPNERPLMSRDALSYLRVLMGEDEEIALFDPARAQAVAGQIIAAGSANPQVLHVALRSAVAVQDFESARKYVAQLTSLGIAVNQQYLDQLDSLEQGWKRELEFRLRDESAGLPVVRIETDMGVIVAELFEDDAPNTVNSFVSLVESDFYNNQDFFNVQAGFLALAGCPKNNGTGDAGYGIPEETDLPTAREHFAGSLTTFHMEGKPASSMFSLVLQPLEIRNGEFTVFGRVTGGFDVLQKFPAYAPTDQLVGKKRVKILKVSMTGKRDHEYTPSRIIELNTTPAVPESTDPGKTTDPAKSSDPAKSGVPPGGGGGLFVP